MRGAWLSLVVAAALCAQSLDVVPMQMGPDELMQSLRDAKPLMPAADCRALSISACDANSPAKVSDVSVRWVQLDEDEELEAILVAQVVAEWTYMAYVFDRQPDWRMVGSLSCSRRPCAVAKFVRVQKLTRDSPPVVVRYADEGGSDTSLLTSRAYAFQGRKLVQVFEVRNHTENTFLRRTEDRRVLASDDRLVVHTIRDTKQDSCETLRWDKELFRFVPSDADHARYCDAATGKPIEGRARQVD